MPGYTGANVPTTTSYLDWVPIKEFFVNNQSSVEFKHTNDGVVLDNTYRVYKWEFINVHPSTNGANFGFQANAESQSGYNETITSATFNAHFKEDNSGNLVDYQSGSDQAQGTSYQRICSRSTGNDNDQAFSGVLRLYDPSSTVFVKHFIAEGNGSHDDDYTLSLFTMGYINTTSKINEISFKFDSGNIGTGKIIMYGLPT
tara:strand:- start:69 stop:671 length:603 start_codon:yes stop_codon:yes gene_type:complete